jgi:hypothetical protein
MTSYCPHCGRQLPAELKPPKQNISVKKLGAFHYSVHHDENGTEVQVPLAWGASIQNKLVWCGGLAGLVWTGVALALAPLDLRIEPATIASIASAAGLTAGGSAMLWMYANDRRLSHNVDEAARREPEPPKPEVTVIHNESPRATWERLGVLPVSAERFDAFAFGVLSGRAPTFREWTPLENGFSRAEFDAISAFLKQSEATDQKSQPTTAGRRALRRYLSQRGKELPPEIEQEGESALPW